MVKKHLNIILVVLILLASLPISMAVAAKDKVAPVISQTKVTTNGDKDVAVSFNLSEKAKVSINVYQGPKLVKKGLEKVTSNSGKVTWSWKGSKAAATYTVKIDAADLAGNKAKTSSGSIKVTAPTNEDLNTKGVFNRSFNLTKAGAKYGPAAGNNVINGTVTIKGNNITLKNITINGTLIVDPGANGEAILDNISAKKVQVLSGAPNSIKVYNLKAPILEIKNDNDVRIVSFAGTKIGQTNVASGATLQTNGNATFGNVDIKVTNQKVKLDGTFIQVTVSGADTKVEAGTGAVITTVKVVAPVVLSGDFSTTKVSVEANNVKVTVAASTQVKEIEVNEKATVTADSTAKITTVDVRADVKLEGTISGTVTISENNITYTIGEGAVVADLKKEAGVTNVTTIYDQPVSSAPTTTTPSTTTNTNTTQTTTTAPTIVVDPNDITKPIVTKVSTGEISQGDPFVAKSNENGYIYMVPQSVTVTTKAELETLFAEGKASRAVAIPSVNVNLDTVTLNNDYFKVYAVDSNGNVSDPSSSIWINKYYVVYGPPINVSNQISKMFVLNYVTVSQPVTLKVTNLDGTVVKNLWTNYTLPSGMDHYLDWDGRNDAGNLVSDGTYYLKLWIGNKLVATNEMLIERVLPQISNITTTPKTKTTNGSFSFDLSEDVYVDFTFYDSFGGEVGTVYNKRAYGVTHFEYLWNGIVNNLTLTDGNYKVYITAKDKAQNQVTRSCNILVDKTAADNPIYAVLDSDDTEITGVTEPFGTITITQLDDTLFKTAQADSNGKYVIPIPVQTAGTSFKIFATDAVGNVGMQSIISVDDVNLTYTKSPYSKFSAKNFSSQPDEIRVICLKPGDIINIYDSSGFSGNLLGSATVGVGETEKTVYINQLGIAGGTVYISITTPGKTESNRLTVYYTAENAPSDITSAIIQANPEDIPGSKNVVLNINVKNEAGDKLTNYTANDFSVKVKRNSDTTSVLTNFANATYFTNFVVNTDGSYSVTLKGADYNDRYQLTDLTVNNVLIHQNHYVYTPDDTRPFNDNSSILGKAQGPNGSKQVFLRIEVKSELDYDVRGLNKEDFVVTINNGTPISFADSAFSNFYDNNDGTYDVIYTGDADNTTYVFTNLTVNGVIIHATENIVTPNP